MLTFHQYNEKYERRKHQDNASKINETKQKKTNNITLQLVII